MPRRSTPIRQWLDNRMLELIKRAKRPVVVGGEAVDVDLSAADLETIRKRLRDMADEEPARSPDKRHSPSLAEAMRVLAEKKREDAKAARE